MEDTFVLALQLHPDDLRRLPAALGTSAARPAALRIVWHDTQDGALAAQGLALAEHRQGRLHAWRLEDVSAAPPPGTPPPVLAEAATRAGLDHPAPAGLATVPVAAFEGTARHLPAGATAATALSGAVRTVMGQHLAARLLLQGPPDAVLALADGLAGTLRADLPPVPLAVEACRAARQEGPGPAPEAPPLGPGLSVGAAFARIVGGQTRVLLHQAALHGPEAGPEPIHQMRVATRRLRSAIKLFRPAVACALLDRAEEGLKAIAAVLGPARDWDVFATGTGATLSAQFPDEAAVARLEAAAARRRRACRAALGAALEGPDFRRLGVALAGLAGTSPWERGGAEEKQAALLAMALEDFAAGCLRRRHRHLEVEAVTELPAEALHALRLHAKRLRYACEFFAPLFPGRGAKRTIRRLADLQEALGALNDGAVAAGLVAELGAARGFAGGLLRGFVAAEARGARKGIGRAWDRFHRLDPFWK